MLWTFFHHNGRARPFAISDMPYYGTWWISAVVVGMWWFEASSRDGPNSPHLTWRILI